MRRKGPFDDPGVLVTPFRGPALAVVAALAALAVVPWAGWLAPPLGVLWAALVVQGTLAGRKELNPTVLLRETPGLLPLWGRSLAAAAFVAFPIALLLGVRYAELSRPDVQGFRVLEEMAIGLVVLLTPVHALLFPGALSLAATEDDVVFLLSPRRLFGRMRLTGVAVAFGFVGLCALAILAVAIPGFVPAIVSRFLVRAGGYALLVLVARAVGLILVQKGFAPPVESTDAASA